MNKTQQMQQEALVQKFFTLFNEHCLWGMKPLFARDAQIVFIPWGEGGVGEVDVLGKVVWEYLLSSFPDLTHTVQKVKMDAYGYLICEVQVQGTQAQDFWAIRNQGLSFTTGHIYLFHFNAQGRIDRMSVNWDHHDFRSQLGAV